ncbi:LAMI_0H01376g1_1 [Lachancea mirantina]|uniref:DNA-(apurinic or apyrimidinic site) lyase n=1 Tax=Lachancea mirantina TaxID=1230905 RepID=A0A1G4KDP4_9SACH|nr:LAMI_0H01376g1_1 [Lachancea mirantina]
MYKYQSVKKLQNHLLMIKFNKILFQPGELVIDNVLHCGQAFRWVFHEDLRQYSASLNVGGKYRIVVVKQGKDNCIEYGTLDTIEEDVLRSFVESYFRLEVPLLDLFAKDWALRDSRLKSKAPLGVRILAQDPWETLVSFICSSNNNISRITKMCHALSSNYGDKLGVYNGVEHCSFPSSAQLLERASESELRTLGFGYRAKYIMGTAQKMQELAKGMLSDTPLLENWKKTLNYEQIRENFMGFPGVGPKVADCVCLSGMRLDHVVPVDVHIARIAQRDYRFVSRKRDLFQLQDMYKDMPITRRKINYELDSIRIMFKELWGDYAGWIQGIVFAQEIGKTLGATQEGTISKRKLEIEVKVEEKVGTEVVAMEIKRRITESVQS